jgi:hypothetical protein
MKMKYFRFLTTAVLFGILAASCTGSPATLIPPYPVQNGTPQATSYPYPPSSGTNTPMAPIPGDFPPAAYAAQAALAKTLNVSASQVKISLAEPVQWSDSCLGVQKAGTMCAQVITPGYKVRLEANGKTYEFHTDQTGKSLVQVANAIDVSPTQINWKSKGSACEEAQITGRQVSVKPCEGPRISVNLSSQRLLELDHFSSTFKAFGATTKAGTLVFSGTGQVAASISEQRSIAEWMQLVSDEALAGRPGATYGIAFLWSRDGGIAGFCDDLAVYLSGLVIPTSCKVNQANSQKSVYLSSDQLDQLYTWIDKYATTEYSKIDPPNIMDGMSILMTFNGTGTQEISELNWQEMQSFASSLYFSAIKTGN